MPDWKKIGFTAAYVLLVIAFLGAGVTKLMGQDPNPDNFENWGYPPWMMYAVGAWEVVFAVMVAVPKTRFYGASLIVGNMVGAALTHVVAGEYPMIMSNVILGGLAVLVALWTLPAVVADKLGREPGVFA